MGELAVLATDQPGPAALSEGPQNQGQVDRGLSVFVVDIDGEKISSTGHERLITKVITDESDEQIDGAVVEMSNVDVSITDDRIFREGSKIKISTGWKSTNLVPRGIFLARRPKFKFTLPGRRVEIVADGEGIKLARTKRQRSFLGRTHSEIAAQIAAENEFEADVEATTIRYPQISQMIESDWGFVKRLAKFSGFLLYARPPPDVASSVPTGASVVLSRISRTNSGTSLSPPGEAYHAAEYSGLFRSPASNSAHTRAPTGGTKAMPKIALFTG